MPPSSPSGSGCLSLEGDGLQLAISVPSFALCTILVVSHFRAFGVVAIPQSGLLAQVSLLWLHSGHSGPILKKHCSPCLPAQPPLASGGCRHLHLCWGSYRWARNLLVLIIDLFFLLVMLPSVLPRLATDSAVRVFPGVWKCLFLRLPSRDGTPFLKRDSLPGMELPPYLLCLFFHLLYFLPTCF